MTAVVSVSTREIPNSSPISLCWSRLFKLICGSTQESVGEVDCCRLVDGILDEGLVLVDDIGPEDGRDVGPDDGESVGPEVGRNEGLKLGW